ncbi:hypothetical protein [Acinetobacter sp.]|uniref:hypothetical protein n=1 Tax=Acinetobacter sp. TaxID=472 RepID=UPI003AFF8FD4
MKYGRIIASLLLTSTLTTAHASNAQQVTVSKVNSEYAKTKYPVVRGGSGNLNNTYK